MCRLHGWALKGYSDSDASKGRHAAQHVIGGHCLSKLQLWSNTAGTRIWEMDCLVWHSRATRRALRRARMCMQVDPLASGSQIELQQGL